MRKFFKLLAFLIGLALSGFFGYMAGYTRASHDIAEWTEEERNGSAEAGDSPS